MVLPLLSVLEEGVLGQPVQGADGLLPKTLPSFPFSVASLPDGLLQVLRTVLLQVWDTGGKVVGFVWG